jgi:hypothetical protein
LFTHEFQCWKWAVEERMFFHPSAGPLRPMQQDDWPTVSVDSDYLILSDVPDDLDQDLD